MKKILVKILTVILALTSVFAISLFSGCDCGDNSGNHNVIPKPDDEVEAFLNLDFSELNLIVGDEAKLTASYIKEEGKTLTYTVEDPNVATVDAKGNVEALNKGTTKIKATYGDLTSECLVSVIFGNYLPELSFEGGLLDTYYVGLDGKAFEFSPIIKFNGKTFYDVDVEYSILDATVAVFENGNALKGLKLGKTTATIKASWRGFTVETSPALQKEVNVETKNVANFLINGEIYDTVEISTFNGKFGGENYSNTLDFKVEVEYNGSVIDVSNVKTKVLNTGVATLNGNILTSKLRGKTTVVIEYTDSLGEKFTSEVNVVVTRPVADSNKHFTYFSSGIGYYKVPENNWANGSIIDDVFGSDASKVVDAFTEDGKTLRVRGNKVLDVPGFATAPIDNVIVVGTDTYAYKISVETYGVIIAEKEDLLAFNVGYRYSDEDFNKATDKAKYLQDLKERPFESVDGYSILVNDIDASGITFNHDAIIPLEGVVHTPAYTVENDVFVEMEGVNANIEYDGVSYAIPRAGYPVLRADVVLNAPIGLRGLFDGQGFKIFNANVQRTEDDVVNGVGIFGAITNGAIIRNVAFVDINAQYSTALAYHLVGGNNAGPCVENVLPKIENVYIKLSKETTNPYGVFANDGATSPKLNKNGHYRFDIVNVILDASSIAPTVSRGIFSSGGVRNTNNALRGHFTNFFIAVHADNYSAQGNITDYIDTRFASGYVDIITAPTMEELFARNDFYKDYSPTPNMEFAPNLATTMAKEFANNSYFEIVGNGVFFKGLAKDQALTFVDGEGNILSSIALSVNKTEQELYLMDASHNIVDNPKVQISNSNALEYVNGKIRIKSNILGVYEVIFTSGEHSKTILVEIGARIEELSGYIQEDGELVEVGGLDANMLDGATYQVNGVNVDGKVESGKVCVDISGVDLSSVDYLNTVNVLIKTTHEVNYEITAKYVTLAIDEAEDLTYFNVGYKFNQADYDSANDKDAYLSKIASDPFDYYEGYYILVKDIDASEIKFNHEAVSFVFADNATSTNLTAGIKCDGTTLTALNTNATIGGYVIPREGYPIVVSNYYNSRWRPYYGLAGYKASKVGFNGTFDGQGHVITGINQTSRDAVKYYTSAEDTTMSGSATIGAGLFGVINTNAIIKNVAFTDVNVSNSAGLSMYYIYDGTGTGSYDKRGKLADVYIETAVSNENWGVLSTFNGSSRGWELDHVIINAGSHTENSAMKYIGSSIESRYLYGGILGGDGNSNNKGLVNYAVQTFVIAQANASNDIASTDNSPAFQDITVVGSLNDLWNATTLADNTITLKDAYLDREYWANIGNCVFFKGLESADVIGFIDGEGNKLTSVLLNKNLNEQEVYLADVTGAKLDGVEVTLSNTDVLEYVDGKVKVKSNEIGVYEATFTYGEYSKTITVEIGAEVIVLDGGYLQESNGEIVAVDGIDLTILDGATYQVDGVNVEGKVESDKILLSLDNVELSSVEYNSDVAVIIKTTNSVNYSLSLKYVSLAIDEAKDLTYFNVGYKFSQTDYDNASDKNAYLSKIASDPFDYYEGYYVLTKDIDVSDIKFEHEAVSFVFADNATSTNLNVGILTTDGETLTALNSNATIGGYVIPREGYPIVVSNYYSSRWRPYFGLSIYKASKVGFNGTFDGQGHVITGLNQTSRDAVKYYTSAEDTAMSGSATIGAGLFGVINTNAIIKNVAFTDVNVSNSSGLAMYYIYNGSATTNYDGRGQLIDVYVETATSNENYGVLASFSGTSRGWSLDHVIINADSHTENSLAKLTGSSIEARYLHGGILGGDSRNSTNKGLIAHAVQTFVISQSATDITSNDNVPAFQDITVVGSLNDLWSATTIADATITIQTAYTDRDMWVVADTDSDGVKEVIFKGLA